MENGIIEFLKNTSNYYLSNCEEVKINDINVFILSANLILYKIEEVVFDEELSRKEAIENILSSVRIEGINFIYIILGKKEGINFYLGISKDLYSEKELTLEIEDIGSLILKPNIKGNLKQGKITDVTLEEKEEIFKVIDNMPFFSTLEGTAGANESEEKLEHVEKLVNIMESDDFGFMVIAKPLSYNNMRIIEDNLSRLYTEISPLAKKVVVESTSKTYGNDFIKSTGESFTNVHSTSISILNAFRETTGGSNESGITTTSGSSETIQRNGNSSSRTNSKSETVQDNRGNPITIRGRTEAVQSNRSSLNTNITVSESTQENRDIAENWNKTSGTSNIKLGGYSKSNTTNSSITEVDSNREGKSISKTVEYVNKEANNWVKYIDEVLFKRLDYGKGRGLFVISTLLFSNENIVLNKLENIMKIAFAGDFGNKVPVKSITLNKKNNKINIYKKFQLPHGSFNKEGYINNPLARSALSQYLDGKGSSIFGNLISTKELSLIIGLPQTN